MVDTMERATAALKKNIKHNYTRHKNWTIEQVISASSSTYGDYPVGLPFPWTPTRFEPSLWCSLFHKNKWIDDWEFWQGTNFPYYYILCRKCGWCWGRIRNLQWFEEN